MVMNHAVSYTNSFSSTDRRSRKHDFSFEKENVHVPKAQVAITVSVKFYPYFMYLAFESELYIGFESSVCLFSRNRHELITLSAMRLSHCLFETHEVCTAILICSVQYCALHHRDCAALDAS